MARIKGRATLNF